MRLTAILLRWYRSFNVLNMGPADQSPEGSWNAFNNELFPFVSVPLDQFITTVVGANESGKSHLLSAIAKVINGEGLPGPTTDAYEIKDICRYCGFGAFDDVWPGIGVQLLCDKVTAQMFEPVGQSPTVSNASEGAEQLVPITIVLNCSRNDHYAVAYRADAALRTFTRTEWTTFAGSNLPAVAILNSELALPNEVHVDELIDFYRGRAPRPVVEPLAMQDLWQAIESLTAVPGPIDAATAQRIGEARTRVGSSLVGTDKHEQQLVHLLFADVLGIRLKDIERVRQYSTSERGYVSWMIDEMNARIENELDISQYWDQDEDFRLSLDYKAGTFHFQITDRTGATYTFNERSSGLRYFLSYYIQAKALEGRKSARGVVILMDEPDNFLSASGQRSLLRVFDSLVRRKKYSGGCQLVYTTHSPFLISKNFPGRLRLVRKGDGGEGTQYVERGSVRRFEPVRSALSIDAADTLFLGNTNVVLEGMSDVKLMTSCIQRFGQPDKLEQMLDLNAVTLVASGGAAYAVELVRKAVKGDEKPPIVVVMLDGDEAGTRFSEQAAKIVGSKQVCTLREVNAKTGVFEVLEDLVPIALLDRAIQVYVGRFGKAASGLYSGNTPGANSAERVASFCRTAVPGLGIDRDDEIRFGVIDSLVGLIDDESFVMAEMRELQENVGRVCVRINQMVEHAVRSANRQSLKRLVRHQIETFIKRFSEVATKSDVRRLLEDVKHVAFGSGEDFEQTRKNIDLMLERLDRENQSASDPVELPTWRARLQRFRNEPWAKVHDWGQVRAISAPSTEAEGIEKSGLGAS